MPQEKLPEPGEFTRMFKQQMGQGAKQPDGNGEEQASANQVEPGAPGSVATEKNRSLGMPPPSGDQPGEFTRYFTGGGLPAPPPKTDRGTSTRTPLGVQRPNSLTTGRLPASDTSGSFTERFGNAPAGPTSRADDDYGVHRPRIGPAPDLSKQTPVEDDGPFDFRAKAPQSPPSSKDGPGEYTSLFGPGHKPPAPRQMAVAPSPAVPMMGDSPRPATPKTLRDLPQAESPKGPSEYTVVANGRPPVAPGAGPTTEISPAAAAAAPTKKIPVSLNVPPINPAALLGGGGMQMPGLNVPGLHGPVGMQGMNANIPGGSLNMQGPHMPPLNAAGGGKGLAKLSDQTKLVLFFALLAILSIILVVTVVATQKN